MKLLFQKWNYCFKNESTVSKMKLLFQRSCNTVFIICMNFMTLLKNYDRFCKCTWLWWARGVACKAVDLFSFSGSRWRVVPFPSWGHTSSVLWARYVPQNCIAALCRHMSSVSMTPYSIGCSVSQVGTVVTTFQNAASYNLLLTSFAKVSHP